MINCEEAMINCDNNEAMTFELAISGEEKEMIAKKGRRKRI